MAARSNPAKVGLFVATSVVAGVVCLFWAGVQIANRAHVPRVTFFDESVQGLDVGAPVKMRGVTIGQVKDITIAPDRRLVKVTAEVYVDLWVRLGLGTEAELRSASKSLPPDLRTQLATTGITGEKFLLVDFFDNPGPGPELTFAPPYNYIPSTPSTLKGLEDGVNTLVDLLPSTLDRIDRVAHTVQEKLTAFDAPAIAARIGGLLETGDQFLAAANGALGGVNFADLDQELRGLIRELSTTTARADQLIARLDAPEGAFQAMLSEFAGVAARAGSLMDAIDGTLASADIAATSAALRTTSDDLAGVAREATLFSGDARATLARLRETLGAVQALAALLERQPGALLRGHATEFTPPGGN